MKGEEGREGDETRNQNREDGKNEKVGAALPIRVWGGRIR